MNIPKQWTFESDEVAQNFDAHVREQLPWYELVTNAVTHLARHYITPNSTVYDIGAATGNIGNAIAPILQERNAKLIAIESSSEMARLYSGVGTLVEKDACDVDYEPSSLIILYLTLQFVSPSKRKALLAKLTASLECGGAIILVDKREPRGGYASLAFYRLTLAGKLAAGAKPEDIISKELSLGGVQRPITPLDWLQWFQFGDFVGYLYESDS